MPAWISSRQPGCPLQVGPSLQGAFGPAIERSTAEGLSGLDPLPWPRPAVPHSLCTAASQRFGTGSARLCRAPAALRRETGEEIPLQLQRQRMIRTSITGDLSGLTAADAPEVALIVLNRPPFKRTPAAGRGTSAMLSSLPID